MNKSIADIRKEYTAENLSEKDADANPIVQFQKWWDAAVTSQILEPNAMTLATASSDGLPSARIVLLKHFDQYGFVFFTNYKSYKAMQLEENPKASLVFFWKELERQVRIVGLVQKLTAKDSDAYYASRPAGSRISAWASPQSSVIENREWLEKEVEEATKKFSEEEILRPPFWGGYVVKPVIIEFWQGRPSRLHDRLQYSLNDNSTWKIERLAP
jgi:pyridoxamine 5'-phosphate oxidase